MSQQSHKISYYSDTIPKKISAKFNPEHSHRSPLSCTNGPLSALYTASR